MEGEVRAVGFVDDEGDAVGVGDGCDRTQIRTNALLRR